MDLQTILDANTPAKKYAAALGFKYRGATASLIDGHIVIQGAFDCVCGKAENFKFEVPAWILDPAHLLRENGAFSREHLVEDGYTADEIDAILSKAKDLQ